jgi:hypothetical protein
MELKENNKDKINFIHKYRVFCNTEGVSHFEWDVKNPTKCPINSSHEITTTNIVSTSISLKIKGKTNATTTVYASPEFMLCDATLGNINIILPDPNNFLNYSHSSFSDSSIISSLPSKFPKGFFRFKRIDESNNSVNILLNNNILKTLSPNETYVITPSI